MKKPRNTSLISLSVAEGRLCAVSLRLRGTKVLVENTVSVPLSLDPMTADAELAGRELRDALRGAGMRGKNCVLCASQTWGLAAQITLPDISEQDRADYLGIQAEREFPYSLADMALGFSLSRLGDASVQAMLFAVPTAPLMALQKVLKEAKLNLLGVTIGAANVMGFKAGDVVTRLGLVVSGSSLELVLVAGGGVRAIRRFAVQDWGSSEEGAAGLDSLMRQLRITLAQMPVEMRDRLSALEVFGDPAQADSLVAGLAGRFGEIGIEVRTGVVALNNQIDFSGDPARSVAVGEIVAGVRCLLGADIVLELPVGDRRVRKGVYGTDISRNMATVGVVVLLLVLLPIGLFIHQKVRLSSMKKELTALQPEVVRAQSVKEEVDRIGAWYTSVPQGLQILKVVAEAYPERGAEAWTTSVEIRGLQDVTISGKASSQSGVQAVHKKLMGLKSVVPGTLSMPRITDPAKPGEPVVYTIEFAWSGEEGPNGL